ncbi:hypothetical protein M5K25_011784 [Dendrobium thyrsiflorum]|uniref:SHSP domain-containing protein n=1 Tax=Dendrobium thyrsiflorum TaxID=117978 RepID=A0ABD0VAK7_DENTH
MSHRLWCIASPASCDSRHVAAVTPTAALDAASHRLPLALSLTTTRVTRFLPFPNPKRIGFGSKKSTHLQKQRSSGSFLRSFRLPENAKVDGIRAAMENGVLTVTIPKEGAQKPEENNIAMIVGIVTDDERVHEIPAIKFTALRSTETARAWILKAGGECLTFDQLALRAPLGQNMARRGEGDDVGGALGEAGGGAVGRGWWQPAVGWAGMEGGRRDEGKGDGDLVWGEEGGGSGYAGGGGRGGGLGFLRRQGGGRGEPWG